MELETMGRVLTEATIENLEDLWSERREARRRQPLAVR
jgi:hypothetical protein